MKLPEGWRETELGELFEFQKKSKHKAGEGLAKGKYKFFTSSDKQTKYIDEYDLDGEYLIFATGGHAGIHYCNEKFSTSTDCFIVKVQEAVLAKYVYYYLHGKIHLLEEGFKGAGLKHISKGYVSEIKVPFPVDKKIQEKIVSTLETVDKITDLRKKSDKASKELIKSVYFDLFSGKNANSWKETTIGNLAQKKKGSMRTGPFGSNLKHSEFVNKGIAVLGIDNAVDNHFSWKVRRFITKEKYKKLKNYTVHPRDVIITIMATVGRSAVIPDDIPLCINTKHLAAISLDEKIANPYFISYSIYANPYILHQIELKNRGAIMPGLNLTIIKELKLKLPPIALQNEFERLYHLIFSLRDSGNKSTEEINSLFNALMQKAFKGELIT